MQPVALLESIQLPPQPGDAARQLSHELGISSAVAEVLVRRGHDSADEVRRFLQPRLAELTPPDGMADREAAADRLAAAIRRHERICVFADYDCDGITSAALLVEVLRALGGRASAELASRFDGGYGISPAAVQRILAARPQVVVACDCGSSDHESLEALRSAGMEAIVIDHHEVSPEPLPAVAFVNPKRPDCRFPYEFLATCGLAFSVAAAIRRTLGSNLDLRQWLDLVAIGTVADVVDLRGDNRALVRAGLDRLREPRRPGVRALLELGRRDQHAPVTGEDIAFRLAPRLNAPGRMGSPDSALELLLAANAETARALAARVEHLSQQRRAAQDQMVVEAVELIERQGWAGRPALVVGQSGWNPGIVGIVAAKLVKRFQCPVAVVGFDSDGQGRGSVRGPEGCRLHDALSAASSVLDRFGGHQAAAGLEVRVDRMDELRQQFERACEAQACIAAARETGSLGEVYALSPEDDLASVLLDLERLEPCGTGNPVPRWVVQAGVASAREVRGGHLKLDLTLAQGQRLAGFAPSLGDRAGTLTGSAVLVGTLHRDTWRGGDAAEIKVERILS